MVAAATGAKLTQAEAELWCHTFGYLKSTALRCAINLGIPTAIHRLGGATSLSELHAALPVAPTKRLCLSRIMTFLSTSGIFTEETMIQQEEADPRYHLTTASRLLVDDDTTIASRTSCVSQLLTLCSSPLYFTASQNLAAWLKEEDDGAAAKARTPFAMAHNEGFYEVVRRDVAFGACFDEAMASDSRFVSEILVREYYGEVFAADGVRSVVDVGGHNGTTARAIARRSRT
ncbi:hypothetical protein HU200_040811 [Digitaria exilis]|uniref:Uncharacterized protein n=1 Tax=Digitaria exilis TaxID=1010633 RepID=A0A835B6M2_9POAL|nr:hypothetical protein HU200_040811 [Digitaria exilis]CAB3452375.1 unnamed protein product [Digitaria exilis]